MLLNIPQCTGQAPPKRTIQHKMPIVPEFGCRSVASLLPQTYHLIHGVTGVVVFRVGTPNPHRLKELLLLLLVLVGRRLLQLLFLDGGIILFFARALAVTPSVFFFLPTSSLLLPTGGATSKGGEGGQLLKRFFCRKTILLHFVHFSHKIKMPCQTTTFTFC